MAEDSGFASDPLAIRAAALERRRKMMAAILGKQMEGEDKAVEVVGGVAVPAWGAAVSKLANAASRAYQERGFQQEEAQLLREGQLRDEAALAQYKLKLEGQPAVPGVQKPLEYDQGGGVFTRPVPAPGEPTPMVTEGGRPAVPRDFQGALDYAAGSPSAKVQALAKAAKERADRVMQTPGLSPDMKAEFWRTGDPAVLRGERFATTRTPGGQEARTNLDTGEQTGLGTSGNVSTENKADLYILEQVFGPQAKDFMENAKAVKEAGLLRPGLENLYADIDRAFTGAPVASAMLTGIAQIGKFVGLTDDEMGRIPATQMISTYLAPLLAQRLQALRPASDTDMKLIRQAQQADLASDPRALKMALSLVLADELNKRAMLERQGTALKSVLGDRQDGSAGYARRAIDAMGQGLPAGMNPQDLGKFGVEVDAATGMFRARSVGEIAPRAPAAPAAVAPPAPATPVVPQAPAPTAPVARGPVAPQVPTPAAATPPAMQVSPEVQRQRDLVGLEMRRIELQEAQGVLAQAQAKGDPAAVAQAQSVVQNHLREIAAMEKQLGVVAGTTAPPMPDLRGLSNDEFARLLEERRRGRQ